jgi:predicted alpha/beta hydrolase
MPINSGRRHIPAGGDDRRSHGPIFALSALGAVVAYTDAMGDLDRDFVGSSIGGFIPALWGDDLFSYSAVLFSGVGSIVGLWLGSRTSR